MGALPWWRHLALAALVAGLLLSRSLTPPTGWEAATPLAAGLLIAVRPRGGSAPLAAICWLLLLALAASLLGLGAGQLRLEAIAAGAAPGAPGERVVASGYVSAPARGSLGELRFPLQTSDGRLMVVQVGGDRSAAPGIGTRLRVRGRLARPEPWRADELQRQGAALELRASEIEPLPGARGGLTGLLDRARQRAEQGVGDGLSASQAALARGFVLGQDEEIDESTREQFRRSGLAHLLRSY